MLKSIDAPAAIKVDLTTLLHCLPAPDADASVMVNTVMKKLFNSNVVDDIEWDSLMRYAKSFDLIDQNGI